MFIIMYMMTLIMMISMIIMLMASTFSKKKINNREKSSPFECGFEPFNSSRLPFSIQFFLIAIIFLIFDVEIALMLPMILSMNINNIMTWFMTSFFFIFILILGLYHEWNQGALEWSK